MGWEKLTSSDVVPLSTTSSSTFGQYTVALFITGLHPEHEIGVARRDDFLFTSFSAFVHVEVLVN